MTLFRLLNTTNSANLAVATLILKSRRIFIITNYRRVSIVSNTYKNKFSHL